MIRPSSSRSWPSNRSISGECPGTLAGIQRARTPWDSQAATSSLTAVASPETLVEYGPLTAATATRFSHGPSSSRTRSSGATIPAIPPSWAVVASMRDRSATILAPSSRVRAPAATAAAISPWEWPITASGVTPSARQTAARDTITANSTGWTTSIRSRSAASGPPRTVSIRDQDTQGSNASAHARSCSAKTGLVSHNSRPIDVHWDPWPGKTNTVPPVGRALPDTTPAGFLPPSDAAVRPASSSSRSAPITTWRCSNRERVATSERPTPARDGSGSAATHSLSRSAWSRSASAERPDSTQGTTPGRPLDIPAGPGTGSPSPGASSRMRCAFVPLTPKDETPARRGRPAARGQSRASVSSSTAPDAQSTCGVRRSTCRVLGSVPWRIAMIILIVPPTPAAACV